MLPACLPACQQRETQKIWKEELQEDATAVFYRS
jgi:hypothetical protein